MVTNRASLPIPESVQERMTFATNIRVLGVVLTLAVRSSWELPTFLAKSGTTLFSITRCITVTKFEFCSKFWTFYICLTLMDNIASCFESALVCAFEYGLFQKPQNLFKRKLVWRWDRGYWSMRGHHSKFHFQLRTWKMSRVFLWWLWGLQKSLQIKERLWEWMWWETYNSWLSL